MRVRGSFCGTNLRGAEKDDDSRMRVRAITYDERAPYYRAADWFSQDSSSLLEQARRLHNDDAYDNYYKC